MRASRRESVAQSGDGSMRNPVRRKIPSSDQTLAIRFTSGD